MKSSTSCTIIFNMGNLVSLKESHEQFALEYLFGEHKGNASKCYALIYNNGETNVTSKTAGYSLLGRDDIKQFLAAKKKEQEDLFQYRKIANVEMLSQIAEEMLHATPADTNGNPLSTHLCRSTAIKAIAEQNKMLGLNEEKADVTVNGGMQFTFNLVPPTDEDEASIEAEINAIRKEKGDVAEDIDFEEYEEED